MKSNQIETTRKLISQLQEKHNLTQKEIARKLRIREPDLSKAKNPKAESESELSEEKRASIINKLRQLLSQNFPENEIEAPIIIKENAISQNGKPYNALTYSLPIADSELRINLMYGSIVTALIAHIFTVVLKDFSGYAQLSFDKFTIMIVFSFVFHLLFGILFGYLTYAAISKLRQENSKKYYVPFLLLLFITVLLVIGLNSRDGYLLCSMMNKDCHGLLGEPNFELIATTLAFTLGGFALVRFVVQNNVYTLKHAFRYAIKYATICALVFISVYLLFLIAINTGLIIEKDYIINTGIFKFSFSHPERVTQTFIKVSLFIFLTLTILKYRVFSRQK